MPPNARSTATELESILSYLIDSDLAVYTMPVERGSHRVSWHSSGSGSPFITDHVKPTAATYEQWVSDGQYSAVLFDGSLLQVTYLFGESELESHRLAYVPAPFEIDEELLLSEPMGEVVELYAAGRASEILLKGTMRFDFDRSAARPEHPAAHFTVNSPTCRIACHGPLRLGLFVDIVFRHFYPEQWAVHPFLQRLPKGAWGPSTLTLSEMKLAHVAWDR